MRVDALRLGDHRLSQLVVQHHGQRLVLARGAVAHHQRADFLALIEQQVGRDLRRDLAQPQPRAVDQVRDTGDPLPVIGVGRLDFDRHGAWVRVAFGQQDLAVDRAGNLFGGPLETALAFQDRIAGLAQVVQRVLFTTPAFVEHVLRVDTGQFGVAPGDTVVGQEAFAGMPQLAGAVAAHRPLFDLARLVVVDVLRDLRDEARQVVRTEFACRLSCHLAPPASSRRRAPSAPPCCRRPEQAAVGRWVPAVPQWVAVLGVPALHP